MSLVEFHGRLGNTLMFYAIFMAVWGLWRWLRKEGISSNFSGAAVIAVGLAILQGLLGTLIWALGQGSLVGRGMHVLYGAVAALTIPAIFAFTRGERDRRTMLIYGLGFLFLMGIALRGMATSGM